MTLLVSWACSAYSAAQSELCSDLFLWDRMGIWKFTIVLWMREQCPPSHRDPRHESHALAAVGDTIALVPRPTHIDRTMLTPQSACWEDTCSNCIKECGRRILTIGMQSGPLCCLLWQRTAYLVSKGLTNCLTDIESGQSNKTKQCFLLLFKCDV